MSWCKRLPTQTTEASKNMQIMATVVANEEDEIMREVKQERANPQNAAEK